LSVVREILTPNLFLNTDEVITRARKKGLRLPDSELRRAVIKTRSAMKAKAREAAPTTVPAAARHIVSPKVEPEAQPASETTSATDLPSVFANVVRVNGVLSACGSVEIAREVAEAVRACGSVDAFLQHLDLVAEVRAVRA